MLRPVLWSLAVALLCGGPFYCFFFHCPVSKELLAAKRSIRVGMTLEEARKLMPSGYNDHPSAGWLSSTEYTSVQCQCTLSVTYRKGVVVKVELSRYDDLTHKGWSVE